MVLGISSREQDKCWFSEKNGVDKRVVCKAINVAESRHSDLTPFFSITVFHPQNCFRMRSSFIKMGTQRSEYCYLNVLEHWVLVL